MKVAFLYAGQGSQHVGMGADFYDAYPAFRAAFEAATLDFDLKETCFTDADGKLSQTEYTQPCMVAFAAGVTAVFAQEGIAPEVVAGLSLGEYSALHAAGVMDAKTAIETVSFRGKAMMDAAKGIACGMTAVLGLDEERLQQCCAIASDYGVVQICNYNCKGQIVIGGEKVAVDACGALAKDAGAKRCLPLNVSGPFHTALMKPAGDALAVRFAQMQFAKPNIPVLYNTLGGENTAQEEIPSLLVAQVQSSVKMKSILHALADMGVDTVVEIGPGKVLSGFVKKTVGSAITCYPVETVTELQAAVCALRARNVVTV